MTKPIVARFVQDRFRFRSFTTYRGNSVNWEQVEGHWQELRGTVRQKWAKLSDDDVEAIAGKKDRLLGKLQTYYGHKKQAAEQEEDIFMSEVGPKLGKFSRH